MVFIFLLHSSSLTVEILVWEKIVSNMVYYKQCIAHCIMFFFYIPSDQSAGAGGTIVEEK